jgi:Tfp pilus assembly protein PilP
VHGDDVRADRPGEGGRGAAEARAVRRIMRTRSWRTCTGILVAALWAGHAGVWVGAQAPAQKKPAVAATQKPPADVPPSSSTIVERPASPEIFTYKPEGRRDPFVSLINRAIAEKPTQKKPDGVRGLSWDEISVRGIYMGQKGPVALIQGPDTKTYQVKVGDQLYDAVVKAITADSLVVLQEVNDPLSLQKQRERRKSLRVAEEVK